jgi:uncharacterized protein (DUF58 family)
VSHWGWPVPTKRAVVLAAIGLVPAAFASLVHQFSGWLWFFDAGLLVAIAVDFGRAPRATQLTVERMVPAALSSGRPNPIRLHLDLARPQAAIALTFRDWVSPGPALVGHQQSLTVSGPCDASWSITPHARGDLTVGPLTVRLNGPMGLCQRQVTLRNEQALRVYPDLIALSADALALARAEPNDAKRVIRKREEGREFESMREYRPGDDKRTIDWKATARRAKTVVRIHRPERNQVVWLFLDCGRQMAGQASQRRKLDAAVDAALRLAKVAIDAGDQVGVVAFGAQVTAFCPLGKGAGHLHTLARFLYRIEASLEESNLGLAIDRAFARQQRRSLVVVLTDLFDVEASRGLVHHLARLTPRHLALVVSLRDEALHALATASPRTEREAHVRHAAARLEVDATHAATRLTRAGTKVVRAMPEALGASAVSAYLDIKDRGLL